MRKKRPQGESVSGSTPKADRPTQRRRTQTPSGQDRNAVPIVGIGASAGGLEAFTKLLDKIPLDSGLGFVLVQHLDPERESALAQILTRSTRLPVCEATNRMRVEADHVYIIPPNTLLTLVQGRMKLEPRRADGRPQRTIDAFFESLAHERREWAVGVILSGTASDGTVGLEAIKAEGGITFAQDETAKYDSMPRNAIASGCVDFVLSPEEIAKELARIAKHLCEVELRGFDQQDASGTTQEEGGGRKPPHRPTPRAGCAGDRWECVWEPGMDKQTEPAGRIRATGSPHSCCSSASIPVWISPSTNQAPSTAASHGAWS